MKITLFLVILTPLIEVTDFVPLCESSCTTIPAGNDFIQNIFMGTFLGSVCMYL